jgi:hypothetical protein
MKKGLSEMATSFFYLKFKQIILPQIPQIISNTRAPGKQALFHSEWSYLKNMIIWGILEKYIEIMRIGVEFECYLN